MAHDTRRPDRVAEAIREEVATFLAEGVKDPRVIGLVTVTGVDVTRDLRHAKVYVSILGSESERAATLDGLGSVASHLRSRIGRALRLRLAPEIEFKLDQSVAHAARIETLLAQLHDERPAEASSDTDERPPRAEGRPIDGILLVDKPAGMTSHDVVSVARRALGTRRIGHAGTLDPFATGLLVLLVGNATRLLPLLDGEPKVYEATIVFGSETDTDDVTGTVVATSALPDVARVADGIASLTGTIDQVPPAYSAKQVEGRRAYDAARRGKRARRCRQCA